MFSDDEIRERLRSIDARKFELALSCETAMEAVRQAIAAMDRMCAAAETLDLHLQFTTGESVLDEEG